MTHPFPTPNIKPLERLYPTDGLLINAERWRKDHEYHRIRQNTHYQSLNQPGIVCGLGVISIPAPANVDAKYRDGRWVQIQPGIAIDVNGNLIVVPISYDFPIDLELVSSEPLTIYLVVSYVDPDELRNKQQRDIVQETYRIDQRNSIPNPSEIEICRILLKPGENSISQPADIFNPGYNQINLLYRRHVQARPQALVKVAQVLHSDDEYSRNFFNLGQLLESVETLYPRLRGTDEPNEVSLSDNLQEYDLLYVTGQQGLTVENTQLESLKTYLNLGGTLLVDVPFEANNIIEIAHTIAQELETPLKPLKELFAHPLKMKPFLFSALPTINKKQIKVLVGGGIILIEGDLGSNWGIDRDPEFKLPRFTIRTAQELGINILHYAYKKRQLLGLQQEDNSGNW